MAPDTDPHAGEDDALNWAGDESLEAPPKPLPHGWKAVGKGSDGVPSVDDPAPQVTTGAETHDQNGMSNGALIGFGIFAGIYLLYTIGWIVSGLNLASAGRALAGGDLQYAITSWIAAAAAAIWFALSMYITRQSKTWVRFAWLGAGVLLLVPWPMFMLMGASS